MFCEKRTRDVLLQEALGMFASELRHKQPRTRPTEHCGSTTRYDDRWAFLGVCANYDCRIGTVFVTLFLFCVTTSLMI